MTATDRMGHKLKPIALLEQAMELLGGSVSKADAGCTEAV